MSTETWLNLQPITEGNLARFLRRHLGAHWVVIATWPDGFRQVEYALRWRWWARETAEVMRQDELKGEGYGGGVTFATVDARTISADRWERP